MKISTFIKRLEDIKQSVGDIHVDVYLSQTTVDRVEKFVVLHDSGNLKPHCVALKTSTLITRKTRHQPSPAVAQPVADGCKQDSEGCKVCGQGCKQPVADERVPLAAVTRERVVAEIERVADVYGLDIPDTAASKATEELVWQVWRALCQPAEAKPTDCSGDPQCCPQNEGYGCNCSALAAKDKP